MRGTSDNIWVVTYFICLVDAGERSDKPGMQFIHRDVLHPGTIGNDILVMLSGSTTCFGDLRDNPRRCHNKYIVHWMWMDLLPAQRLKHNE